MGLLEKLLLPIDGSERSLRSAELVKELFPNEKVEVTLITVVENYDSVLSQYELEQLKKEYQPRLDEISQLLPGYQIHKHVAFGKAGQAILDYADRHKIDAIIITKATHGALSVFIGSVAAHVVKYAKCLVMIAPDKQEKAMKA